MSARPVATLVVATLCTIAATATLSAQKAAQPQPVELPTGTLTLEGVPRVRIDDTETGSRRHVLDRKEADRHQFSIQVKDGQFFRGGTANQPPLKVEAQGAYTYLSAKPGSYIRFTRMNDRIAYVEHLEEGQNHVTFWGELRIVIGK